MKILNTNSYRSTLPSCFRVVPRRAGWRGRPDESFFFSDSTGAQGSFGDISVTSSLINMQIQ